MTIDWQQVMSISAISTRLKTAYSRSEVRGEGLGSKEGAGSRKQGAGRRSREEGWRREQGGKQITGRQAVGWNAYQAAYKHTTNQPASSPSISARTPPSGGDRYLTGD